jgi:hypothetical protein
MVPGAVVGVLVDAGAGVAGIITVVSPPSSSSSSPPQATHASAMMATLLDLRIVDNTETSSMSPDDASTRCHDTLTTKTVQPATTAKRDVVRRQS